MGKGVSSMKAQDVTKKTRKTSGNESGKSRRYKYSAYSVIIIAIVVVLVIVVNVLASVLDNSFNIRADITEEQYTVLSDDTNTILGKLDQEIYLYYIGASENDQLLTTELLKNYASASPNVHYQLIDPDSNPGFTQQFDVAETGIESDTVIISDVDGFSGDAPERFKVLEHGDIFSYSTPYYDQNGDLVVDYKYFRGEQKITSAIDYIITGETKRAIFLSGHLETAPCKSLGDDIYAQYYEIKAYDFKQAEYALNPSSDTLIVISPRTDLSDDEYEGIRAFLEAGGQAIFFMDSISVSASTGEIEYVTDDLENFRSLLMLYDLSVNRDVVVGGDPAKTYKTPTNIIPALNTMSSITLSLAEENLNPVLSYASSINMPETTVADVSVTKLLETDSTCYAKTLDNGLATLDKEPGDREGKFVVGAIARKNDTSVVLYTSASFAVSEENYAHASNARLFQNTLSYLNQKMDSVSIGMKTVYSAVDTAYKLDIVSDMQKVFFIIIVVGVVPLIVLIIGVVRWFRRRRL